MPNKDDRITEKQIEERRDAAVRRALSTPPKPKQQSAKPKERKPRKASKS